MTRNRFNIRNMLGAFALIAALGFSLVAEGASAGMSRTVVLTTGKAETVMLPKSAADVLVANPAIADVGSLRADRLYVVGKQVGDTNVLAFDDAGNQLADIAVHVRVDEATLRNSIREFFPKEALEVRTVNDQVILKGRVSNPAVANQVRDLAGRFIKTSGQSLIDLMTVEGEQQVMLKVKVIEARREVLREFGIDTTINGVKLGDAGTAGFNGTAGVGLASLTPFGTGTVALANGGMSLASNISGLERDGLVNTLAEPTLTAISGETAGFLAGGEFPVPTGRDNQGNVTIEFKQFGVSLNFIPTVLSSDRISLQLTSEVSEKSDQDSVTLVNTIIPGLTVRRAQTTVQMGSGGTLMIAGLLKSRTVDAVNGFPGLKSLPIIGELFKSKSFQRGESELVFVVTPYIVEPYAQAQADRVAADPSGPHALMPMSAPLPPRSPLAVPTATTTNPASAPETRFGRVRSINNIDPPPRSVREHQGADAGATIPQDAAPKLAAISAGRQKTGVNAAEELTADVVAAAPVETVSAAPLGNSPAPVVQLAGRPKPILRTTPQIASKPVKAPLKTAVYPIKVPAVSVAASTPANAPVALAAPEAKPGQGPLTTSFADGLKKVYGNRAPTLGAGASYGYIVD